MITNEKQYRSTRALIEQFRIGLSSLVPNNHPDMSPDMLSLQRDARLAPASAPVRIWLGLPGRGRIDRYTGLVEQDGQLWSSNCGVFAAK